MKLKIGIVCPYDFTKFGGVRDHIRGITSELRRRGHTVMVITPTPNGGGTPEEGVIYVGSSTSMNTPFGTTPQLSVSGTPQDVEDMYNREQFDVIHFHEPWVPVLSGQLLARSDAINVATFHAKMPEDVVSKSLEKMWLPYGKNVSKHINYITAVSSAAVEYVAQATDQQIEIIPNGIELEVFDPSKITPYTPFDDDIKTILSIGRLEKRKGVEYLIKAYEQLREIHNDVRLVIAGDGPKRRALQNYVERNNIPDVSFLGFVSDEDKLKLLKVADLFASPALFGESFGIVLLEAMAMKTPVVAGNNSGYASVMKGTGRVSLVDPKATTDFMYRLELMLFDEGIQKLFLHWAADYIKQFDFEHITDAYEQVYLDLMANNEAS